MIKKTSFIGVGRLGLSMSLLCEHVGIHVMAVDKNEEYVKALQNKTFKTVEPYVEEYLKKSHFFNVSTRTNDALEYADVIFCVVATPSLPDGSYSHAAIEEVVSDIITYAKEGNDLSGKTLAICCTVMPQYSKMVSERLNPYGVTVVYNPEFIRQYSIVDDLSNADVVLIGHNHYELPSEELLGVYRAIMHNPPNFKFLSLTGAEIAKVSLNCYLTTKISFANYVGQIVANSGIGDETEGILKMIGSDSRIGNKFFSYGFGYGGVCLIRDNKALGVHANRVGLDAMLPETIDLFNERHLQYLKNYWIDLNPEKFPFIFNQISYKKNSNILTESQPYELCKLLLKEGYQVIINETEVVHEVLKKELNEYLSQISFEPAKCGIEIN